MLKELAGNPGKRKLPRNEPKAKGDLADAPEWMSEQQKAGWAYAMAHAPRSLLKRIDRSALAIWVVAEDFHRQAVTEQNSLGRLLIKTEKSGATIQSPYLAVVNRQALIMLKAAQELGFSPAARPRLASGRPIEVYEEKELDEGGAEPSLSDYLASNPSRLN